MNRFCGGKPQTRGRGRACEPHVGVPETPARAARACNSKGTARAFHFHGTCAREVRRGSSGDDFGDPVALPHEICKGLSPSPTQCEGHEHWQIAAPCNLANCEVPPTPGTATISSSRGTIQAQKQHRAAPPDQEAPGPQVAASWSSRAASGRVQKVPKPLPQWTGDDSLKKGSLRGESVRLLLYEYRGPLLLRATSPGK